ncbi:peptidoglycan DD-metalloendopeptidase family protein [Caldinitratiruptor microaerophilus]|uniref:LysM domain-containing protein n=1 Tax=Caldinitratiruptor microaerophilus TaxID=671077 RepID=A0AA35CNN2_9FIRM|nr:M23 family metallopeptidase [Caldinitratiruptor microaerophilus]BDG61824.1 hypothetical protein caldi_29140 [Caldinitratiruptor microaerophilus]
MDRAQPLQRPTGRPVFYAAGVVLVAGALALTSGRGVPEGLRASPPAAPGAPAAAADGRPSLAAGWLDWLAAGPDGQAAEVPARFPGRPGRAGDEAEAAPPPRLLTYTVRPGDTLWDLARRFGTDTDTLLAANPNLASERIQPGQELRVIAHVSRAVHKVQRGETLAGIARQYGVPADKVAAANGLDVQSAIVPGQELIIPGARPRIQLASRGEVRGAGGGWIWPVRGRLTSGFGPRWGSVHPGIDIGAPAGTTAVAARAGRVVEAGWDGGYGLSVVIDHGGGVKSRYGHASALLVRAGQQVEQGQPILKVGSTGFSTGPHLHFEIIVGGRQVDPRKYLP